MYVRTYVYMYVCMYGTHVFVEPLYVTRFMHTYARAYFCMHRGRLPVCHHCGKQCNEETTQQQLLLPGSSCCRQQQQIALFHPHVWTAYRLSHVRSLMGEVLGETTSLLISSWSRASLITADKTFDAAMPSSRVSVSTLTYLFC
jgi:hypothetical protein